MENIPDVLGMEFDMAKALLEAEGLDYIVVETKPSKREEVDGILRVIKVSKQLETEKMRCSFILTVCKI